MNKIKTSCIVGVKKQTTGMRNKQMIWNGKSGKC